MFTKDSFLLKDAKTLYTLNSEYTTERMTILQLETIYDFYKKLGYNLEEDKYTSTRKEISSNIQNDYIYTQKLEFYLIKNDLINEDFVLLSENFKKSTSASEDYEIYKTYQSFLYNIIVEHIYSNNLIDKENEKQLIKQETGLTSDIQIAEILQNRLSEKISEIINSN